VVYIIIIISISALSSSLIESMRAKRHDFGKNLLLLATEYREVVLP